MPLTKEQIDQFHQDGFIIVDDVFDPKDAEAAFVEMEKIFYGKSFDEYLAEFDETGVAGLVEPKTTGAISHYGETRYGRPQFPTGIEALGRLIENDDWLDMYEQCLGTQDLSYCNGHLFLRSGPTDKRHAEHPWQGYHIDNATNNFLPPHRETDLYHYVNSSIYLHDVPDDCAQCKLSLAAIVKLWVCYLNLFVMGIGLVAEKLRIFEKFLNLPCLFRLQARWEAFDSIVLSVYMLRFRSKTNEGKEDTRRFRSAERIPANG